MPNDSLFLFCTSVFFGAYSYCNSGGGVTFSGGECMLQLDFLREILEKCKAAGIYTAGNVLWESFNIPNNSF